MNFNFKVGNIKINNIEVNDIEVSTDFTMTELSQGYDIYYNNFKKVVKELPSILTDLKTAFNKFNELDKEETSLDLSKIEVRILHPKVILVEFKDSEYVYNNLYNIYKYIRKYHDINNYYLSDLCCKTHNKEYITYIEFDNTFNNISFMTSINEGTLDSYPQVIKEYYMKGI